MADRYLDRYETRAEEARQRDRDDAQRRTERLYAGDWVVGRLLEARKAPYHDDPAERPSYTIKLKTPDRTERLWGVDLERAVTKSKSKVKVGDMVAARITRTEILTIPDKEPNKPPKQVPYRHWDVEQVVYAYARQRVAREILKDPITARRAGKDGKLVTGSYLLVAGAEMMADILHTRDEDRKAFVSRIREAAGLAHDRDLAQRSSEPRRPDRFSTIVTNAIPKREGFTRE